MKSLCALCMVAMLLGGCDNDASPAGLPVVAMRLGSRDFKLEVAATEGTRDYGLMHRDSMPSGHGMIFVFSEDQPLKFYMRHTRIPLDIVYINAAGQVVSIHQMQPYDESTTASAGPAKWAVELNKGEAGKAGIKAGDQVTIPEAAKVAKN